MNVCDIQFLPWLSCNLPTRNILIQRYGNRRNNLAEKAEKNSNSSPSAISILETWTKLISIIYLNNVHCWMVCPCNTIWISSLGTRSLWDFPDICFCFTWIINKYQLIFEVFSMLTYRRSCSRCYFHLQLIFFLTCPFCRYLILLDNGFACVSVCLHGPVHHT